MLDPVYLKAVADRWRGLAIAAVALAAMLYFAMPIYAQIDISIYTDLPEGLRTLVGISADADASTLAYTVVFGAMGALTLAGVGLAIGASAFAGEERRGTIGLLLANPRSRTHVLVAKAAALLTLVPLTALALWVVGELAPVVFDVDVGDAHVGAAVLHLAINTLFYGFLALAVGGLTGSPSLATGVTAGVMVVSYIGVGFLPLVEGAADLAKVLPWYYFDSSRPLNNGADWGHLAILGVGVGVFAATAVAGVRRRDLRGRSTGTTLLDRLRANPTTARIVERLAGQARVSAIWVRAFTSRQGLIGVVAVLLGGFMGLLVVPMYTLIDENLASAMGAFPEEILVAMGGGDMSTPEGYVQSETFGLMAPIGIIVVTALMGARALAGEEAENTMGLLLGNPISRSRVVWEKAFAMILAAAVVGVATFAGHAGGLLVADLGIPLGNVAAICLQLTLLGLVFGGLALTLGAATGRSGAAIYGTAGAALVLYVLNSLAAINDSLGAVGRLSPFHYYTASDPLVSGLDWADAGVLTAIAVVLIGAAPLLFRRRDLRQR